MSDQKYTSSEQPKVGDSVLVRLNFCDEEGQVIRQEQFQGLIERIEADEVVLKNPDNGKQASLPPYFGSYVRAEPGVYELPSTGETVVDPHYITEWTLREQS